MAFLGGLLQFLNPAAAARPQQGAMPNGGPMPDQPPAQGWGGMLNGFTGTLADNRNAVMALGQGLLRGTSGREGMAYAAAALPGAQELDRQAAGRGALGKYIGGQKLDPALADLLTKDDGLGTAYVKDKLGIGTAGGYFGSLVYGHNKKTGALVVGQPAREGGIKWSDGSAPEDVQISDSYTAQNLGTSIDAFGKHGGWGGGGGGAPVAPQAPQPPQVAQQLGAVPQQPQPAPQAPGAPLPAEPPPGGAAVAPGGRRVDVAGEAAEKKRGEDYGEARGKYIPAYNATQSLEKLAGELSQDPNLDFSVGADAATVRSWRPGSPVKEFRNRVDTLKSKLWTTVVQSMRGLGSLSNAEGEKLGAMVANLDPDVRPAEFRHQLALVMEQAQRTRMTMQQELETLAVPPTSAVPQVPGAPAPAGAPGGGSDPFGLGL